MRVLAPVCLMVGLLAACAGSPLRIESSALPSAGLNADRYIITAVDNDAPPFVARAGGTPRGYDAVTPYGATAQALGVMRAVEHDYGLHEVSAWPIQPLNMHCAVLEIPSGSDRAEIIAELTKDRRVRLVQPLQSFATRTGPYNDPYVGLQRGFQEMGIAQAQLWSQGEGVKIAIIDTGADIDHPDLARNVVMAQNFVDNDAAAFRSDRHGTEMAGVIAAVANNGQGIVGVAPQARLLIFKACWQARRDADAASCNSFTLARALTAALDARVQVVNLSLSGPSDPLLGDLIQEGVRRGIVFVGAVSGLLDQRGVIRVENSEGRVSDDGVLHAPGTEILTLLPGGHYDFATGDSISTAQVTGVVALMLAKDRALTASAAYQLLRETSSDAGLRGKVDACAALVALVGQGSCEAATTSAR